MHENHTQKVLRNKHGASQRSVGRAVYEKTMAACVRVACLLLLTAWGTRAFAAVPSTPAEGPEPAPAGAVLGTTPLDDLCVRPKAKPGTPDKAAQKLQRSALTQAEKAYEQNNYVEAARALQQAYEAVPQREILFNLAQSCREGGALLASLTLYQAVLAENANDSFAAECRRHIPALKVVGAARLSDQAQTLAASHQFDQAIQRDEAAYKLDPKPIYVLRLAETLRKTERTQDAILAYERYLTVASTADRDPAALGHLAHLRAVQEEARAGDHTRAGEHTQAMSAWQAAYRSEPKPIYTFQTAQSAEKAGVLSEAVASYQRFLRDTPPTDHITERTQAESRLPKLEAELKDQKRPIYKRWWFWAAVGAGAAVAAGSIAAGVIAGQSQSVLPGVPMENQRVLQKP